MILGILGLALMIVSGSVLCAIGLYTIFAKLEDREVKINRKRDDEDFDSDLWI